MAQATTLHPEYSQYLDIGAPPPERAIFSTGEKVAMLAIPFFTLALVALAITGACGGFQNVLSADATPGIVQALAISSGVLTGVQLLALPGTIRHYNNEIERDEMERKEWNELVN